MSLGNIEVVPSKAYRIFRARSLCFASAFPLLLALLNLFSKPVSIKGVLQEGGAHIDGIDAYDGDPSATTVLLSGGLWTISIGGIGGGAGIVLCGGGGGGGGGLGIP